jgi:hypothetical protein
MDIQRREISALMEMETDPIPLYIDARRDNIGGL